MASPTPPQESAAAAALRHHLAMACYYQKVHNENVHPDEDSDSGVECDAGYERRLREVKQELLKDTYGCDEDCMCNLEKLLQAKLALEEDENNEKKPPVKSPVKSAVNHRFHNGKLFLYCLRDTKMARPEYLRLCQVPRPIRLAYFNYLEQHGCGIPKKEVWTIENERELRIELDRKHAFSEKDQRQQYEIEQCMDSNEWDKRTGNGSRVMGPLDDVENPGPAEKSEEGVFWAIERLLGVAQERKTNKLFFLVKWKGWPHESNTWETIEAMGKASDLVLEFFELHGEPSPSRPKIMLPDGIKFEKWVEDSAKGIERPLKQRKTEKVGQARK